MNSNFEFIKSEWPEIFEAAVCAEKHTLTAPRTCAFYCRYALERTVYWLYEHDKSLRKPFQEKLAALLHEDTFVRNLGNGLFNRIRYIHNLGNHAAHSSGRIRDIESLTCLRHLFALLCWLTRTYSKNPPKDILFKENLIPKAGQEEKSAKQLQQLQKQLVQKDKLLEEQRQQQAQKVGTVRGNVGKLCKLLYNRYMRRERITYPGAYHHVMNRGYDGNDIFVGNKNKSQFLDYLEGTGNQMMIRLFAYCVMDNHYHLVLENSSGRMSDFLKLLNGQYGMYYRKNEGDNRIITSFLLFTFITKGTGELLLLSEVESGKTKPGYDLFYNLSRHFPVNFSYLLHGKGEMFLGPDLEPAVDYGPDSDIIRKMLEHIIQVPMIRFAVLEFYQGYLYDKRDLLNEVFEKLKKSGDR